MAASTNDNSVLYTPVRITNPEDIVGGGAAGTVTLGAGTASFGKLSANTASTYIGDTVVPLATSVFDVAEATQSGTATQLASHACVYGTVISNTHASAILYVGGSTVTSTRYIYRLLAGESTPLIPVSNSNLLYVKESASCTYTYGGM
jgi:hypothetical protein